jgi:hypothetical protein
MSKVSEAFVGSRPAYLDILSAVESSLDGRQFPIDVNNDLRRTIPGGGVSTARHSNIPRRERLGKNRGSDGALPASWLLLQKGTSRPTPAGSLSLRDRSGMSSPMTCVRLGRQSPPRLSSSHIGLSLLRRRHETFRANAGWTIAWNPSASSCPCSRCGCDVDIAHIDRDERKPSLGHADLGASWLLRE